MDIFEQASRMKLRFESTKGLLSVEDLWDLPLSRLDAIAVALHRKTKEAADTISFVTPVADTGNSELLLAFEIAKHVIDVRVKERDDLKAESDRREKKQRLLELIAKKEDAALGEKSVEELRALAESL